MIWNSCMYENQEVFLILFDSPKFRKALMFCLCFHSPDVSLDRCFEYFLVLFLISFYPILSFISDFVRILSEWCHTYLFRINRINISYSSHVLFLTKYVLGRGLHFSRSQNGPLKVFFSIFFFEIPIKSDLTYLLTYLYFFPLDVYVF